MNYLELQSAYDKSREQLIKYADDVTKLYMWQRQLEKYLPDGLLDKLIVSADAVVGERRYVTVLFADVVDFTNLSSGLDPEDVFLLMNNCFKILVEQVYKFGGTVDKFVGDGIMAIFGAPISYGNDAERAVRAAIGMQEAMKAFNESMFEKVGRPIEIRIGLTSGDVIAGTVGSEGQRSYTVMGSTVNMASRLETAAEAQTILVNDDVYYHTREFFRYEVLSPISVKGIERPVAVYRVVEPIRDSQLFQRFAGDKLTPFVGCADELGHLQKMLKNLEAGEGFVTFITGDVGLGKSRLAWEWQRKFPPQVRAWSALAQSLSQQGYEPWQQLVRNGLDLQEASSAQVRTVLHQIVSDESWIPFLEMMLYGEIPTEGRLHSLQPEQLKEQVFVAMGQLLQSVARRHPLVLILDNLQWFDQLSRELLLFVMDLCKSLPLGLCVISRQEARALPDLVAKARQFPPRLVLEIPLLPLSTAESEALLNSQLPLEQMSERVRTYILERAQNNPYFLEELISLISTSDSIERLSDPNATEQAVLANLSLPGTLRGLVLAQIDQVPEIEQRILDYAAVIGPSSPSPLLISVLAHHTRLTGIPSHLANLVKQGIFNFDGSSYHFTHNIVQETIYQGLLTSRRQQLHAQVGDAIKARAGDDLEPVVEQLAHHFSAAEQPALAIPHLITAGEKAQRRFATEMALSYFSQALSILPSAPSMAHHETYLHKTLGELHQHTGEYDLALDHYHEAMTQVRKTNERADYSRLIGQIWQIKGEVEKARHWLEKALQESAEGDSEANRIIRGRIYADMARFFLSQGEYELAERWSFDAVNTLTDTDALADLAHSLNILGDAYYFQNRWQEASRQIEQSHQLRLKIGDRLGIANSLSDLGRLYMVEGAWQEAIDVFERSISLCEEIGALERTLSNAHNNLAHIFIHQGILDQAQRHLDSSIAIKRRSGITFEMAATLNNYALRSIMMGDYPAAERQLKESIKLAQQHNEQLALCDARRYLAEIRLAQGRLKIAADICNETLELSERIGSVVHQGQILRVLARVQCRQQDLSEAMMTAFGSLDALMRVNFAYEIARTQVVIAEISISRGDDDTFQAAYDVAYPVLEELNAVPELASLQLLELAEEVA